MSENKNEYRDPFISVIIPVYNCPEGLRDTLQSLVNQDFPKGRYEILPVDNNSTDETPDVIGEFEKKYPGLVRGLAERDIQSSYAARNKGIKNAKGEVLVFIDADMWTEEDFLKVVADSFEEREEKYVGFDVEIVVEDSNLVSEYNKLTGFQIERHMKENYYAGAGNIAVSKKIFEEVGLFDYNLISSGDSEFGKRVYGNGFKMEYRGDTKLYHPARNSLLSIIKKWFRIGRGNYQLTENHTDKFPSTERSVFNPKYLLPEHPDNFSKMVIGWDELRFTKKLNFYLMKWFYRIFKHFGYVYEKSR